jgi:hypothetical protein
MDNFALEKMMDMLVSSIMEDEDRKILSALGLINLDERNKIATVKLHNGRSISIYRDAKSFIFKYFNRMNNMTIDVHEAKDIMSGVEYFMKILEQTDLEILWNWFLDYGK